MFGPIIGAIGAGLKSAAPKLISGFASKILGGGGGQRQSNSVDYGALRDGALANGFNPLTALRNGGAAGHAVTTMPSLSSGDIIADALGTGLETAFNQKQIARDEEREQLEVDIMRQQLLGMQKNNAVQTDRNFGYSIPHARSYSGINPAQGAAVGNVLREVIPGSQTESGIDRADINNPREFETDIWTWLLNGSFWPNAGEIWDRNGLPYLRKKRAEKRERDSVFYGDILDQRLSDREKQKDRKAVRDSISNDPYSKIPRKNYYRPF